MRKLFLPVLFFTGFIIQGYAQQRLFDQPVQLRSCTIKIDADPFIATTTMELEFYNPQDKEVEGFQRLELSKGQVITGFQLELNGKYREGSIEERWKANRAYSAIVGKRIDPAIIQMEWQDNYSLRIYPIAAHSTRKVKIIISQLMKEEEDKLVYTLPLGFSAPTKTFSLSINASHISSTPVVNKGLIEKLSFTRQEHGAQLEWAVADILLDKPVSFALPLERFSFLHCAPASGEPAGFLLRTRPSAARYIDVKPETVTVFWDVSSSSRSRAIQKELDFLEAYVELNKIRKITLVLFNQQVKETIEYATGQHSFTSLRKYLAEYNYTGATQLGTLDLDAVRSDAILLFSDGRNSFGSKQPMHSALQVDCIVSSITYDLKALESIVGTGGGRIINLLTEPVGSAAKKIDKAENFLMRYAGPATMAVNERFPVKLTSSIVLSGMLQDAGNLQLFYGNNSLNSSKEEYYLPPGEVCSGNTYKMFNKLKAYDSLLNATSIYSKWRDLIQFGLKEGIVTANTSYLVLERIEDYINYNIAPPKELEEKCAEMNYVYKSEYKLKQLNALSEKEMLKQVAGNYNLRIRWWDKDAPVITSVDQPVLVAGNTITEGDQKSSSGSTSAVVQPVELNSLNNTGSSLKEVVVTGAFNTRRASRSVSSSVQNISYDQLNTIRQSDINNALAGKVAGIQVRSQAAAALGRETIVRLRGENSIGAGKGPVYVLDGTIMPNSNDINIDDIEDVTILQGPAASALFGPDGANGAVVINSKRAKRWGNTGYYYYRGPDKLSAAEDEDYVKEIRNTSLGSLWKTYKKLQPAYTNLPGFYFDMADYFYKNKLTDQAMEIFYDGIEACSGNSQGLKAAAYLLESWKKFDDALYIYKQVQAADPGDRFVQKDIALLYFQAGDYQKAVDEYYAIITRQTDDIADLRLLKEQAMAEMNAVIAMYKDSIDISSINPNLIKPLPVDLRIVVCDNANNIQACKIVEPGGNTCSYVNPETRSGGHLTRVYLPHYYSQWSYYNMAYNEYSIKKAEKGDYRIKIFANDYNYSMPWYVRIITFRNFQKAGQRMEVAYKILDNMEGEIEIGEVKW